MKIYRYPKPEEWPEITERPYIDTEELTATVKDILKNIKEDGDEAVRKYEEKFDHVKLDSLEVSEYEISDAKIIFQTNCTML